MPSHYLEDILGINTGITPNVEDQVQPLSLRERFDATRPKPVGQNQQLASALFGALAESQGVGGQFQNAFNQAQQNTQLGAQNEADFFKFQQADAKAKEDTRRQAVREGFQRETLDFRKQQAANQLELAKARNTSSQTKLDARGQAKLAKVSEAQNNYIASRQATKVGGDRDSAASKKIKNFENTVRRMQNNNVSSDAIDRFVQGSTPFNSLSELKERTSLADRNIHKDREVKILNNNIYGLTGETSSRFNRIFARVQGSANATPEQLHTGQYGKEDLNEAFELQKVNNTSLAKADKAIARFVELSGIPQETLVERDFYTKGKGAEWEKAMLKNLNKVMDSGKLRTFLSNVKRVKDREFQLEKDRDLIDKSIQNISNNVDNVVDVDDRDPNLLAAATGQAQTAQAPVAQAREALPTDTTLKSGQIVPKATADLFTSLDDVSFQEMLVGQAKARNFKTQEEYNTFIGEKSAIRAELLESGQPSKEVTSTDAFRESFTGISNGNISGAEIVLEPFVNLGNKISEGYTKFSDHLKTTNPRNKSILNIINEPWAKIKEGMHALNKMLSDSDFPDSMKETISKIQENPSDAGSLMRKLPKRQQQNMVILFNSLSDEKTSQGPSDRPQPFVGEATRNF